MSYSDQHYAPGDPDCPTCGGVGYVIPGNVPTHHPKHGKAYPCPACSASDLAAPLIDWDTEPLRKPLEDATRYALDKWLAGETWRLGLIAPPDGGQSTLLEWLECELRKAGRQAKLITYVDFENALTRMMQGADTYSDSTPLIERLCEYDVLLMDEIPSKIQGTNAGGQATYKAQQARSLIEQLYRLGKSYAFAANVNWWDTPVGHLPDVYWSVRSRLEEADIARMDAVLAYRSVKGAAMRKERQAVMG